MLIYAYILSSVNRNSFMSIEAAVRILAGTMVLFSLILGLTVNVHWLYLTAFVGLNLLQSGFTGFCPAESVFRKLGLTHRNGECQ